jgi:hypothetical protein
MNFKPGDLALHIGKRHNNLIVEVLSHLQHGKLMCRDGTETPAMDYYEVDPGFSVTNPDSRGWGAVAKDLVPIPPDRDVGSWDDCVFKPGELITEEGKSYVDPDREQENISG